MFNIFRNSESHKRGESCGQGSYILNMDISLTSPVQEKLLAAWRKGS